MQEKINFIQEGREIPTEVFSEFENAFENEDYYFSKGTIKSNFTGIIIENGKVLACFPKHFFGKEELNREYIEKIKGKYYIRLLLKVIIKSATKKSERSLGIAKDVFSSFPFKSFYRIYEYYKKFGLFSETIDNFKYGYSGKINWKKTIENSPLIVNEKSVMYLPMVIQKKENKDVFITKCMAFAIDSTIDLMKYIIKFDKTGIDYSNIDFSKKDIILKKLHKYSREVFKDKDKMLIKNLIIFFKNIDGGSQNLYIKANTFSLIWEEMVENYLNNYFIGMDSKGQYLKFSDTRLKPKLNFENRLFIPDASSENIYSLELDHYLNEDENVYIFDSKYYNEISKLDYKQVSYYYLTRGFDSHLGKNIYNALITPQSVNGRGSFKIHFRLKNEFNNENRDFVITEQYLNMKKVMKEYISS